MTQTLNLVSRYACVSLVYTASALLFAWPAWSATAENTCHQSENLQLLAQFEIGSPMQSVRSVFSRSKRHFYVDYGDQVSHHAWDPEKIRGPEIFYAASTKKKNFLIYETEILELDFDAQHVLRKIQCRTSYTGP